MSYVRGATYFVRLSRAVVSVSLHRVSISISIVVVLNGSVGCFSNSYISPQKSARRNNICRFSIPQPVIFFRFLGYGKPFDETAATEYGFTRAIVFYTVIYIYIEHTFGARLTGSNIIIYYY